MKHIYIFNTDSQAGDYGIGTYLRELKVCLHSEPEITLTFVELQSVEKEFSVVEMAGVRYIKIPSPQTHPSWQFQAKRMKAYNLAVCCLLKKCVNAGEENVFHLNYLQHDSLVPYLRKMIPLCKIIYTIHYLNRISNNENKNAYYDEIGKKKHEWIDAAGGFVYDSYSRMKAMCQSVDKVICLSLHTFNLLQTECELSQNKLFFISNGLQDEALMLDEEQKRVFKDELSLTVNEKVVLFVGRPDAAKGLLLLIRAFYYKKVGYQMLLQLNDRTEYVKNDLCLCHGHSSLILIYKRIYELTCDKSFLQRHLFWQEKTKILLEAKITEYRQGINSDLFFENLSLFTGFLGSFLSLFASDIENDRWAKILLL